VKRSQRPAAVEPAAATAGLDPELAEELERGGWETSWALTPELHTPACEPGARQATWTLERMIEADVRDALVMSKDPCALDLACGEGWLCHRLLAWGAKRVVGVEGRAQQLRRARLLRQHFAIAEGELELRPGLGATGRDKRYDVVVLTGLGGGDAGVDGLLERAAASTAAVCVIECAGASADALGKAAVSAGFRCAELVRPPLGAHPLYLREDRVVLIAHPPEDG